MEEQPPLATPVEKLDTPGPASAEIEFTDRPPLPRVWFLDGQGNGIIQVQRDCFLHNWRKLNPDDQYPRFRNVIASFKHNLEVFTTFVTENELGDIKPVQCELTYVNHIFENALWSPGKSLDALFPDFGWRDSPKRFLPVYEGANWRTAYRLPDRRGRLHAGLQIGFLQPSGKPLVSLEMKARGIGDIKSLKEIWPWFDIAHEWIVRGFTDVTSEKAQKELWGRTQ